MSIDWLRKCSLIVAPSNGAPGLDLGEFKIQFGIKQANIYRPNEAAIRVFNLAEKTARTIQTEFFAVSLSAGYEEGPFGEIFAGTIVQVRRGKLDGIDTYTDIFAADGDLAHNWAAVKATLPAGSTPADQHGVIAEAVGKTGVTEGYVAGLTGPALPRSKVMFGQARDYIRDLGFSQGAAYSVQSGKLQLVPNNHYIPGAAVVLNSKSGLIGRAEVTADGISARCLLNPNLKIGRVVQIDEASITQAVLPIGTLAVDERPEIAADGLYKLIVVEHDGDTRGNPWYSNLICIGINASLTRAAVKDFG